MSRKKRIWETGGIAFSGAATGVGIAKATSSVGVGVVTAAKTGVGVKAAPAFAVLGALAFLGASVIVLACTEKKKYSWQ